MPSSDAPETASQSSMSGCLVRLAWLLVGNIAFLFAAKAIVAHRGTFLSTADLFYWAVVVGLVAIRYADIAWMKGFTASGIPATMAHWRRYVAILAVIALCVWGLAHGLSRILG